MAQGDTLPTHQGAGDSAGRHRQADRQLQQEVPQQEHAQHDQEYYQFKFQSNPSCSGVFAGVGQTAASAGGASAFGKRPHPF